MRCTIALAALVFASPGMAMMLTDGEAMAMSCRVYLASLAKPIFGPVVAAIYTRLSGSPNADRFGTPCNMGDYVLAECRAHPKDDLRAAIARLERAGASGRLPMIPICGA